MKKVTLMSISFLLLNCAQAQDLAYIKRCINTLSAPTFGGRGYVNNGRDKAAQFVSRNYKEIGLQSFSEDANYYQEYRFSVNTFPNKVELKLGKKDMIPGVDFLIDAASTSFKTISKCKIERINLNKIDDSLEWQRLKATWKPTGIYQLRYFDSFCKKIKSNSNDIVKQLPKGCFIIPQTNKLIWTVATDTIPATVFYVADTAMPKSRRVEVQVQNKFDSKALNKNVIGYVQGTDYPDSFFVFTAHYDHLGRMGSKAVFPGANDNASGTSFMLALAKYFKEHAQKYSIAFIAFSGEEAGLLGSKYYVSHPVFPLNQIKCLVNIDLMGDATDGIMVVNALAQQSTYDMLQNINNEKHYLPKISSRDNAPNSDHYPFTQVHAPAIFIYAMGGKGFYHDVFDKPKELSLNRIPQVFQLLTDLVEQKSMTH
jgi:aminopeptidase YwaD